MTFTAGLPKNGAILFYIEISLIHDKTSRK